MTSTIFTTSDDIRNYLLELDPGFAELTDEEMRDLIYNSDIEYGTPYDADAVEIGTLYNAAMAVAVSR